MRPVYETQQDRNREFHALNDLKEMQGLTGTFLQTQKLAPFDALYINEEGEQVSIWEVKIRSRSYEELMGLGGLYLSLEKLSKIVSISTAVGLPAYLLLHASDGLYTKSLNETRHKLSYGGRTDRGDEKDRELCALITDFQKVGDA